MKTKETLTLKEYMYNNRMTVAQVAGMVDYSQGHIQSVISGKYTMSKKLARAIEKATQGVVKEETIFIRNIA